MNSKVLDDIYELNERYHNNDNNFKIVKLISENEFKDNMKYFIDNYKKSIKNIEIIDTKNYYDNNNILKISDNGNMELFSIKKLKYIKYNNKIRLDLYNERKSTINNFVFKQHYDNVIKMKKILFHDIFGNLIEFIVSMKETDSKKDNKSKSFYINIIIDSNNISNNIIDIMNLLNKND